MSRARSLIRLLAVAVVVLPAATVLACGSGGSSDADVARYLQADSLPSNPSTRVEFGRGRLPGDFPAGLPVPDHATLLGWQRTTTDSAFSWEAIYEAPGDPSRLIDGTLARLNGSDWRVIDRSAQRGFESLNLDGQGKNAGRTGVIAIGPSARAGYVLQLAEIGEDRK